jgi:hypothetical protein
MSSLHKMSTDLLSNRVVVRGRRYSAHPPLSPARLRTWIFKDDVNSLSSSWNIYFMPTISVVHPDPVGSETFRGVRIRKKVFRIRAALDPERI